MNKPFFGILYLLATLLATDGTSTPTPHKPAKPHTEKKSDAPLSLKLPSGFTGTIVAEDLGPTRHIAITKNWDFNAGIALDFTY